MGELREQKTAVFGSYTAYLGKLAQEDSRAAYVTGPTLSGRIAPLASFWRWEEAVAWAKKRSEEVGDKEDGKKA